MKRTDPKALRLPAIVRRAIIDAFMAMLQDIDSTDPETGKPVLNRQTRRKVKTIAPIIQRYQEGRKITTAEQVKLLQCLHVSDEMSGKMTDINAISTACTLNPICRHRAQCPGSICTECFAMQTFTYKHELEQATALNLIILNLMEYSPAAWKAVAIPASAAGQMFRVEAFGDAASAIQAANYIIMAKTHRYLGKIGIWSKNLGFWGAAFERLGKPSNIVFNASSPAINTPAAIPEHYQWFIDHVFTVYDAAHAIEHGININCGLRNCKNCKRCYTRGNDPTVSEILKADAKKYYKAIGIDYKGRGK